GLQGVPSINRPTGAHSREAGGKPWSTFVHSYASGPSRCEPAADRVRYALVRAFRMMEKTMRTLFAVTAVAGARRAPVAFFAETAGHQSTGTQTEFRQSVKAERPTHKRRQIIRSELNKNEPNVRIREREARAAKRRGRSAARRT